MSDSMLIHLIYFVIYIIIYPRSSFSNSIFYLHIYLPQTFVFCILYISSSQQINIKCINARRVIYASSSINHLNKSDNIFCISCTKTVSEFRRFFFILILLQIYSNESVHLTHFL